LRLSTPLSFIYAGGTVLLLISIILGAIAFTSHGTGLDFIGADVTKLIDDFDKGVIESPIDNIRIAKLDALSNNFEIIKHKKKYFRWLIYVFVAGMTVLTLLTIIAHCCVVI